MTLCLHPCVRITSSPGLAQTRVHDWSCPQLLGGCVGPRDKCQRPHTCWRDRCLCCEPCGADQWSMVGARSCWPGWCVDALPPRPRPPDRLLQSCCSMEGFGPCLDLWDACGTPRAYFWLWTDLPRGKMEGKTQLGWWDGHGRPQDVWEKLAFVEVLGAPGHAQLPLAGASLAPSLLAITRRAGGPPFVRCLWGWGVHTAPEVRAGWRPFPSCQLSGTSEMPGLWQAGVPSGPQPITSFCF